MSSRAAAEGTAEVRIEEKLGRHHEWLADRVETALDELTAFHRASGSCVLPHELIIDAVMLRVRLHWRRRELIEAEKACV